MRKEDLALMRKTKRGEDKNRVEKQPVVVEQMVDGIAFDLWWIEVNKQLNLPHYIKEIMLADFKGRGLGAIETAAKYNEALALFGYKL